MTRAEFENVPYGSLLYLYKDFTRDVVAGNKFILKGFDFDHQMHILMTLTNIPNYLIGSDFRVGPSIKDGSSDRFISLLKVVKKISYNRLTYLNA